MVFQLVSHQPSLSREKTYILCLELMVVVLRVARKLTAYQTAFLLLEDTTMVFPAGIEPTFSA